jgi:hypothetical protein
MYSTKGTKKLKPIINASASNLTTIKKEEPKADEKKDAPADKNESNATLDNKRKDNRQETDHGKKEDEVIEEAN